MKRMVDPKELGGNVNTNIKATLSDDGGSVNIEYDKNIFPLLIEIKYKKTSTSSEEVSYFYFNGYMPSQRGIFTEGISMELIEGEAPYINLVSSTQLVELTEVNLIVYAFNNAKKYYFEI